MATVTAGAFQAIAAELEALGLGDLFTFDNGVPGGWLWEQMQQGFDTSEELALALKQTDVYKDRFAVIVDQEQRAAAGENVHVMTPAEVLDYERQAKQIMMEAGLPEWFYDEPSDFRELIGRDISPVELKRRTEQVYEYVDNAAPEVREAFEQFYGVAQAPGALAAFVLDPERTAASLEKAGRTAFAGGMARRFDIQLNRERSQELVEQASDGAIVQGLEGLSAQRNLFEESRFEDTDLTLEGEGLDAEFFGSNEARTAINRRLAMRKALDRVSTGGAATTQAGVVGASTAGGR